MSSRTFRICGGEGELVIYDAEGSVADVIFDAAIIEARRLERIFNFFDPKSELSRLNERRDGLVSAELLQVVKLALSFCELTEGKYDVSLGRVFRARKEGRLVPKLACSHRDVRVDGERVTLLHSDVLLDLGSIAKGFMVDGLVGFLKRQGVLRGFVDLRGDMRSFGGEEEVAIQHPRKKEGELMPFVLKDEAVATSGDYKQFDRSFDRCHIIGQADLVSVTVVAKEAVVADALATCAFVGGSAGVKGLADRFQGVRFITVDSSMRVSDVGREQHGR